MEIMVSHVKEIDGQKYCINKILCTKLEKNTEIVTITVSLSHGRIRVTCINEA